MSDIKTNQDLQTMEEEQSSFNFQTIYTTFILNWKWFVLSVFICLGIGFLYLRYTTPIYNTKAKLLIKDDDNRSYRRGGIQGLESMSNLGIISNSYGIENEQEILTSTTIAEQAVRDLKIYVTYYIKGRIKKRLIYKKQPLNIDMDYAHLDRMNQPIKLSIKRNGNNYKIKGTYFTPIDELTSSGPYEIDQTITNIPSVIRTKAGIITITSNGRYKLEDGETLIATIQSPRIASYKYVGALSVEQSSKTSSVLNISLNDQDINRGMDYLRQLVICYNGQANEDKNEIAAKTEEFINDRLAKISTELSSTDGALENFKRNNKVIELQLSAQSLAANTSNFEQKLNDANTQISLINSLIAFANRPGNKHQVLPSNVGLQDQASTSLINEYNKTALERNRLLRTASESSPVV